MKGRDQGVLFQNSDGSINMGVWFSDPDLEMNDIFWYNTLAMEIYNCAIDGEELISMDSNFGTQSCYVELHRIVF